MQNIYAFDVGDFGKLGLLRHLHSETGASLGVLWWRTHLGSAGADGRFTNYFGRAEFRECDPGLHDEMEKSFRTGERLISSLEPLLPAGTLFHDAPIPFRTSRANWFAGTRRLVEAADLVFCDPDDGIAMAENARSPRHVALSEIRQLYEGGHSLVIYHHLDRTAKAPVQIQRAFAAQRAAIPAVGDLWAAQFRRGSGRVFFVIVRPDRVDQFRKARASFEQSPWCRRGHFECVDERRENEECLAEQGHEPNDSDPHLSIELGRAPQTLTVWFGAVDGASHSESIAATVLLLKDQEGRIVGIRKLDPAIPAQERLRVRVIDSGQV